MAPAREAVSAYDDQVDLILLDRTQDLFGGPALNQDASGFQLGRNFYRQRFIQFRFRVAAEFGGQPGYVGGVFSIGGHGRERWYDVHDEELRVEQTSKFKPVGKSLQGPFAEI